MAASRGLGVSVPTDHHHDHEPPRPADVGILALEVYFPATFVSQAALEAFDGVSGGKYTEGLGQEGMAVCTDREDVVSMSLTGKRRRGSRVLLRAC